MKILYKREYPFLNDGVHSLSGEIMESRPFQLITINRTISDLYLIRKYAFKRKAQHSCFLGTKVIRVIQILNEHEVSHLLDNIQRICDSSVPKDFPQTIDLITKFSGHFALLLFFVSVPNVFRISSVADFDYSFR